MSSSPLSDAATTGRAQPRSSLLDRWFRPVGVPPEAGRDLAELARQGSIVFVMRSAGVLNFIYLRWLLRKLGLPALRSAFGLTGLMPSFARARPGVAALEEALARGDASVVFLRRARGPDPFPILTAAQRRLGRPIFLVPALLVWTRRPQKLKPTVGEILFGTPDAPSRFANAIGFLLNRRRAILKLGGASDLSTFTAERPDEPDALLARKVRSALHLHLAGEVRAVVGPPLKTAARVREQVLRDRSLRRTLEREAQQAHRSPSELQAEASRYLREIASRYSPVFIEFVRPLLALIFGRLYDAIDVDEEGLARVKRMSGENPLVLCPSHKSYVDFLVLSWVFYEHGMTPPQIAAGINLAFWPFGFIARHAGAFFIRRTLGGNRVYTATLRAYVKQLLRDRFPQEFYPEGGRSRTGKLLFPKTGLFSMEVDAWLEEATHDVLFVPVAIDYERLVEGRAYAKELAGGEKDKENLGGLLRARKVLGRRYGRLTIQFEEPISLRAFTLSRLGNSWQALGQEEAALPEASSSGRPSPAKRALVQALANRVAFGINRAITMTPVGLVAASLLAHVRRGLPAEEVARRVELLREIAARGGARFSRGFAAAPADPRLAGPVADAVVRFIEDGLVKVERAAGETIYQVVEDRRPLLDYHKNAVIHRYVPLALLATAARAGGAGAGEAAVKAHTLALSRLFKLEFMYQVGAGFDALFEENVAALCQIGALAVKEGCLEPGGERGRLDFLADLLRPYLEAYRVVAEALEAAPEATVDRRALVRAALERGRAAYASGRIALMESLSKASFENAVEWFAQQGGLSAEGRAWREAHLPALLGDLERDLAF